MATLDEKFEALYNRQQEFGDKILLGFFKSSEAEKWKLHYIWNAMSESEFDLVAADTVYEGTFVEHVTKEMVEKPALTQVEIIPGDDDIIGFESDGEYTEEELKYLHMFLDQALHNTPRDWKFVHINWINPATDQDTGRSLYFISLEDAIDDQKDYEEEEE